MPSALLLFSFVVFQFQMMENHFHVSFPLYISFPMQFFLLMDTPKDYKIANYETKGQCCVQACIWWTLVGKNNGVTFKVKSSPVGHQPRFVYPIRSLVVLVPALTNPCTLSSYFQFFFLPLKHSNDKYCTKKEYNRKRIFGGDSIYTSPQPKDKRSFLLHLLTRIHTYKILRLFKS